MAHILFLLESAGLDYTVKNITKNTEQKKRSKKMRKEKYHDKIIQKDQNWLAEVHKKREQRKQKKCLNGCESSNARGPLSTDLKEKNDEKETTETKNFS